MATSIDKGDTGTRSTASTLAIDDANDAMGEKTNSESSDSPAYVHSRGHADTNRAEREPSAEAPCPESTTSEDAAPEAALAPPSPPQLSNGRRWALTLIVMFSMAMNGGAQTGLNIALPLIQTELGISEANLQWVASAFSLTNGCFLLISGRVADAYGRKRCFIGGMLWYAIWCLVGSFMHSGPALIVTRAMAGAGASMG